MKACIDGIAVTLSSVSLSGVKIAAAKAWSQHHNLSYYDVAFGVETGDSKYHDAHRFMVAVYAHFEDVLK